MNHRRAYSDSDIKATMVLDNTMVLDDNDASDTESVASSSSIRTIDLYTGWRLPDLAVSIRLPGWFVLLVTLLLFRGPSMPPSCGA
jgi:hypothetical protein